MSDAGAPRGELPWRRFGSRAVLLAGVALAASFLLPSLPKEQVVIFRVGQTPPLRRLKVSYTREGETAPLSGATLSYATPPPTSVRHTVSLPDGRYVVALELERAAPDGGARETSHVRRVSLEGGETVLPLEDSHE